MKKYYYYLPEFMIALAVGLALFLFVDGCERRNAQIGALVQAAAGGPDSGRVWRDRYDHEHRRSEAAEGDRKTIQMAYGRLLDSVARLNEVKARQIDAITWLSTRVDGTRNIAVVHDTFFSADPWMDISGSYQDSTIHLNYELRDSLIITTIRKPVGLFRKATFVDVASADSEMHITGVRTLQVRERRKPWGIGLQVGAALRLRSATGGIGWAPYAGLGVSYNFIRF